MPRASTSRKRQPDAATPEAPSPWEWLVAGIGALLVASAIGYLVYFAQVAPASAPLIRLAAEPAIRSGDGFLVAVRVVNDGGMTAAAVEIEGTLSRDGATVETARATLDYAPRFSGRRAGLFFATDPRNAVLRLRVLGYAEP